MCLILSWNAFSWVYLLFLFERIINKKVKDIRKLTKIEDESARMVMFFLLAGVVSVYWCSFLPSAGTVI